jgi:putative ABC transport system permease protein
LVAGELALTIVLLSGAGLLIRSVLAMNRLDDVVAPEILTTRFSLPTTKYQTAAERLSFFRRFEEALSAAPGIEVVSLSSALPFVGPREGLSFMRRPVRLDDGTPIDRAQPTPTVAISTGHFRTLGIALVLGREFAPNDGTPGLQTVIVNERFVTTFFGNSDPLGRRIIVDDPATPSTRPSPLTVVGVVPSLRHSPMSDATPAVYVPLQTLPTTSVGVMIRGSADRATLTRVLRTTIAAIDRDVALFNIDTLDHLSDLSRWTPRLISILLGVLAGIGILLATMGLYAVTAYGISQRTTEIGIRMALGAQRTQVAWLFLKQTVRLVAIGLLLGLAGAIGAGQLLQGLLVETRGGDPLVFLAVVLCLSVVASVACIMPLRRATHLDPVTSLRHE